MFKKLYLYASELPLWFKIFNSIFLLFILIWPLVAYMSIFLLDNPENLFLTWIFIFALNAYPLYILILVELNSRLFIKNKMLGLILPILVCILIFYMFIKIQNEIAISDKEQFDEEIGANK